MFSCGSDSCSADDWAGTWAGTITDFEGMTEEVSATIQASGDNSISMLLGDDSYGDITIDGCTFSDSQTESTFLGEVNIDLDAKLADDVITLILDITILDETIQETVILNRQ